MRATRSKISISAAAKMAAVCALFILLLAAACGREEERRAAAMTGGDPARGRSHIRTYGCMSCHTIPGIPDADALVGPPLDRMSMRMYIGGVLENNPDNMIRWLQNPKAVDHLTAMPNVGLSEQEARDIASYLYTLK